MEGTRHGTRSHLRPAHLSTCDTKRVSKAPRVRSCSEASPRKSRSSSTSLSSTSRTSSPMYLPLMSFSYLAKGAHHRAGCPRQQAEPVATRTPSPCHSWGSLSSPSEAFLGRALCCVHSGPPTAMWWGAVFTACLHLGKPRLTQANALRNAGVGTCGCLRASESHPPSRSLYEPETELTQGPRWRLAQSGGPEGTAIPDQPRERGHVCALGTSGSNPAKVAVVSQSLPVPVGARGPSHLPQAL